MQKAASTDRRSKGPADPDAIFWDSLLRRGAGASLQQLSSKELAGRRVLITGAGGSIGSALAQAAAASMPASLVLLESSENGLYEVDRALRQGGWRDHTPLLGNVCHADTVEHALRQYRPEIILHAAALKHVPLMEENPFAAIETNVFGTKTLMDAAVIHTVGQLVLVSTDKAVEPRSIMGASKRIAELMLLGGSALMRRTVVRLCNVIGSQGSVLPLFVEQIERGGPLTVTHPEAQRYFITVEQAVQALFDALEVRATPILLTPDVGPAVRIVELAGHLLEAHGSQATVEFTGLRPGDKVSEQLVSGREFLSKNVLGDPSRLRAIETPTAGLAECNAALETLREAVHRRDLQQLLRGVWALVPEYQPSTTLATALNDDAAREQQAEVNA